MIDATLFTAVNIGLGFCVSWLLSHYALPLWFGVSRCAKRSTAITALYTVAALIRNFGVYWIWTNG